jgi:hypothetical protein
MFSSSSNGIGGLVSRVTPLARLEDVGGGTWKIKWKPPTRLAETRGEQYSLLVACMYGGSRVLRLAQDPAVGWTLGHDLCGTYTAQGSITYGACWMNEGCQTEQARTAWTAVNPTSRLSVRNENAVATCAFYEKSLHLWEF